MGQQFFLSLLPLPQSRSLLLEFVRHSQVQPSAPEGDTVQYLFIPSPVLGSPLTHPRPVSFIQTIMRYHSLLLIPCRLPHTCARLTLLLRHRVDR
ncbi:hypothetical protein E2C01_029548 [Portunus trituberculatus]|uniref:Uncharacterized protein n=1 Tax=Portunus trituberculatus TaxID=210409 RepID=A0A5B7ENP7_PORTR|nr:hypothetical protein [Portunus trituberculatus]